MSTETAALIERLWQADDLDREAAHASQSLTPQETEALRAIVGKIESRISAKRVLKNLEPDGENIAASPSGETITGLLTLLVLAAYHSDTLLFLPAALRHERVREWAERTGFPLDFVKEAVVLGLPGLTPLLEAA